MIPTRSSTPPTSTSSTRRATGAAPSTGSSTFYHQALVAHQAGDDHAASVAFGWLAHYYGDILQPFHTNYAAINLDSAHVKYELLVDKQHRMPDGAPAWMTADRTPKAIADVRTTAIAAAAYSRKYFGELYTQFNADETRLNARVSEITGYVLKRASADLADILYSLDHGVGDAAPAATVSARLKYTYVAQNTTETIYVTVRDAAGRPLEGVRVDIAFPNPAGGTTAGPPLHDIGGHGHGLRRHRGQPARQAP